MKNRNVSPVIRPGLTYLWVMNDHCDRPSLEKMLDGFDNQGVSAVCLHPRAGLLVPYGGDEWFELITWIVEQCAKRGIDVWLYDEDPYPSGSAGGRLVAEQPEYQARQIVQHEPKETVGPGELFTFPTGKLLWCGLVDRDTGKTHDLTARVGMLREQWEVLPEWNSRYYYPDTPLYDCPRAWTYGLTFSVRMPEDSQGMQLVAYTADPVGEEHTPWGHMPDVLNPNCTQAFIESTHERYKQTVGHHFGGCITAMFTDEPHVPSSRPWTPGMFESFEQQTGYDLRPKLWHLFEPGDGQPQSMNTRIHLREWMCKRFEEAWLQPVSQWCDANNLAFVGHISPEDDPVEQVSSVGNLLPLMKRFSLPGIDLIIPAAGDNQHPLINIGVIAARSIAEQQNLPGVMSESLACSGVEPDIAIAQRVFRWQTMMGMTAPVVHAAYTSMRGHRAIDAPPDWGPNCKAWPQMLELGKSLANVQNKLTGARQIAPVAILWPIRTFMARDIQGYEMHNDLRCEIAALVNQCMEHQVGIHFLDEADLWQAEIKNGQLSVGRSQYSHILIPGSTVWHSNTHDRLTQVAQAGVDVHGTGSSPGWIQTANGIEPSKASTWSHHENVSDAVAPLPRLIDFGDNQPINNLRCTSWVDADNQAFDLLINLGSDPLEISMKAHNHTLTPNHIYLKDNKDQIQQIS